jgi:polyvinyl alcohol dehydrogenase (cytochrome)
MIAALRCALSAALLCAVLPGPAPARDDPDDWPTYNRDVLGSRHNPAEAALSPSTAGRLEEKWRFPARGSKEEIGVIHATPVVVGGYVYFGTASDPAFYKLAPDGTLKWSYRNPRRPRPMPPEGNPDDTTFRNRRFQTSPDGILGSALVTDDAVYFGDIGGWFYALDRATGEERWAINARDKAFPDAHPLNDFFASPILAGGKLIVPGGSLEQGAGASPFYRSGSARGFVMALEPQSGRILWKYDVGPKPEPLDPPIVIEDSWGKHRFSSGPATSSVWSTPSFDEATGTLYFGTDVNTAPRRPTPDNPRLDTPESCAVIALNVEDGSPRWVTQIRPGDVWNNGMCGYDFKEGRYKDQSIGDTPKLYAIDVEGTPTKVVGVGSKNGGFYVLKRDDGRILANTPIYTARRPIRSRPSRTLARWRCRGSSAACNRAARPTASRSSPTASTACGWARRRSSPRAPCRRRPGA